MRFRLFPLRFSFVARDVVRFPPVAPANVLRGAFGLALQRTACEPDCPGARQCERRAFCHYARMFEPAAVSAGPSGLADWPRPFVFRARALAGAVFEAGQSFSFDLNLFDIHTPMIGSLAEAFAQLAAAGLGAGRGRAELATVSPPALPIELSLAPLEVRVERVRVGFLTPTELKTGRQLAERPEFGALAARIRDRLSTLRELYDDGPLAIDFRQFGERAARVRMTRCEIAQVEVRRRSSRTGQSHPIGGFIGEAEYEGELSEFIPYLRAASWTGVGRQTVWGKGELAVHTGLHEAPESASLKLEEWPSG